MGETPEGRRIDTSGPAGAGGTTEVRVSPASRPDIFNLLIISDLHLSEGLLWEAKRYSRIEDFLFDEEFESFLDFHHKNQRDGLPWHLIINGDFLDFLQVTRAGNPAAAVHDRGEKCGESASIFKLGVVFEGHRKFFRALGQFLLYGHKVSILPGNHDIELQYDGVRTAFLVYLAQCCGTTVGQLSALEFLDWFYYEPGVVWVEHGGQYDECNSFAHLLAPTLPGQAEIELPLGSLFVRYILNHVEVSEPYADNVKPATRFIRWLVLRHCCKALKFLVRRGWVMAKRLRRAWKPRACAPNCMECARQSVVRSALATRSGIPQSTLQNLDSPPIRAESALRRPPLRWILSGILRKRLEHADRRAARAIADLLDVRYVVMGHTHDAEILSWRLGERRHTYFNTGTWTKVFSKVGGLAPQESEMVYLELTRMPSQVALLKKWRDCPGGPRLVRLLKERSVL